jgi:hypothetical protein
MKRIRILGICLVAAFALSAVASTVASAEPVFVTKAVVGGAASSKIPISGTVGAAFLESKAGTKITCTGGTFTGEITGSKSSANNVTTFKGCESGGHPCENAGAGEIITKKLAAELQGISATLPGERLTDEVEGRGGKLAEFTCAGVLKVIVKGSLIGSLSGAAGTSAKAAEEGKLVTGKLTFAEAAGVQKYSKFSEGTTGDKESEQLESSVGGGAFEKSGQSVIATIKTVPATWGLGVTK